MEFLTTRVAEPIRGPRRDLLSVVTVCRQSANNVDDRDM